MKLLHLFLNPQTHRLRSGWRALIFLALVLLPRLATLFITTETPSGNTSSYFEVDGAMVVVYAALILWVALISWFCLRFLERLPLSALGYAFHRGWLRDLCLGLAISAAMILLVVFIQFLGGGTHVRLNPDWLHSSGIPWRSLLLSIGVATLMLSVAASFEEIVFRGYVFQTLVRDVPVAIPLLLLSLLFGLAHWSNPSRTLFSTTNTVLAGIWLAVAFLKTRSLWLPTGLHLGWNWMMGVFFGIPISGLPLRKTVLLTTSDTPQWLTGGSYGCEGGLAATVVLGISTILIWRASWLRISPEIRAANATTPSPNEKPLQLNLQ